MDSPQNNQIPIGRPVLGPLEIWRATGYKILFGATLLGWWSWLWWFAGQCCDLDHLYSWVSVQLKRDGFSITFGLLTLLSAVVLAWAWCSNRPVRKRIAASCFVMVGGIILPVLAVAFSLIANMGYPDGWLLDMARAAIISVTPVLCLLAVMVVLWLHRSRPRLLVYYLWSAFLAGWLVIPLILSGRLKRGFYHFTHPRFEGVLLTLLSLLVVLVASWTMRNQKHKLWMFCLAGLIAGPGIYLTRFSKEPWPSLPKTVHSAAIRTTRPLPALSDQTGNSVRSIRFDSAHLLGLPDPAVHSQSLEITGISESTAHTGESYDVTRLRPYLTMGWNHPPDAAARQEWRIDMQLSDNGGPRYHGTLKLEGIFRGLRRRPVVSLPAGKTSRLWTPGSMWHVTLKPECLFIKHGHTHLSVEETRWSPHGASAREPWRPEAHPGYAKPDWTVTFSPPSPNSFTVRSHSEYGQFRSLYSESSSSITMKWELFDVGEYKLMSRGDRERRRAERLVAWESWLKTATLTLHEPVDAIVVPFSLEVDVPEFSPSP